jgi:hypothetical protein
VRPAMDPWRRDGQEQETHQMGHAHMPAANVLVWGEVAAAIALVADGRYPRVIVANIADAARIVAALRPDADRCGVELVTEATADGTCRDVVVRRR